MGKKLKGKDLIKIGFPDNNNINITLGLINKFHKKKNKDDILIEANKVFNHLEKYKEDPVWSTITNSMTATDNINYAKMNSQKAGFEIFGKNEIDDTTKQHFYNALHLPIVESGALMPDAHVGYGLPIGGVIATNNAIIPGAVGLDIGCRMSLSIYPVNGSFLQSRRHQLKNVLKENTKFGMRDTHDKKYDHEIFDREDFNEISFVKKLKSKAYNQLGTSGSGNHFVEFGMIDIQDEHNEFGLKVGSYFGLLSHSGSRGFGATIAKHYMDIAMESCVLPREVRYLAWLDMNSDEGKEYWLAMNLAGDYAKACHDNIHERIGKSLGMKAVAKIENHHNYAWKQIVNDKQCFVHRKGATPAQKGQLGIIPGSMTAPGYIVRGLGNEASLSSASHGAGRAFSRTRCRNNFTPSEMKKLLKEHEVDLIGGAVDEAPMAYKDIHRVMNNQQELVEVIGTFTPKIVRMDKS